MPEHSCKVAVMQHLNAIELELRDINVAIKLATPLANNLVFVKRVEKLERAIWKLKSELAELKL